MELIDLFKKEFNSEPTYKATSSGRFEVLGNHTDHNHGLCIAATCNLSISSYLKKNDLNRIRIISVGYQNIDLNLNDLEQRNDENPSSIDLVRGMARYFVEHGYKVGGFDAVTKSDIFPGAGVSSSAAFESLIGQIFNVLFNDGKIDKLFIAKAGQYAENTDFGKKSGLLDQIGCGYGNLSYIDFNDINNPVIEQIYYPFDDLHFVIVNTGGSHAELSSLYSSIPLDMKNAAKKLGHEFLSECEKHDADSLSDIERSRARHFFSECERVRKMKECIKNKNQEEFLRLINESRISSTNDLKNMMVDNQYIGSPLEACDYAMEILENQGACKINGGGFAGSIICVVPSNKLDEFTHKMSIKYGQDNVCEVLINPHGPLVEKI
ncbi:MAG: galactokinase [Bacilli bacterium]|nr:galactokinase [Bacilli bacterium]